MLFMGIDVGTQGVRCVVSDAAGHLRAAKSIAFEAINIARTEGWYEQSPADWQTAMEGAILDCVAQLPAKRRRAVEHPNDFYRRNQRHHRASGCGSPAVDQRHHVQ